MLIPCYVEMSRARTDTRLPGHVPVQPCSSLSFLCSPFPIITSPRSLSNHFFSTSLLYFGALYWEGRGRRQAIFLLDFLFLYTSFQQCWKSARVRVVCTPESKEHNMITPIAQRKTRLEVFMQREREPCLKKRYFTKEGNWITE